MYWNSQYRTTRMMWEMILLIICLYIWWLRFRRFRPFSTLDFIQRRFRQYFRKRLREQELIFFNSKLVFQFRGEFECWKYSTTRPNISSTHEIPPEGYNSRERDWSVLDKSSAVSIPERTHIKADLKCVPKESGSSGGGGSVAKIAIAAPTASSVEEADPPTAAKQAWLPDGYSRIFRSNVFVLPFGLLDYGSAMLCFKIWSRPFLGLRHGGGRGRNPSTLAQSKERKGSSFAA